MGASRGLITEPDLLYSTNEKLLENLSVHNIIDVRQSQSIEMIKYILKSTIFSYSIALLYVQES